MSAPIQTEPESSTGSDAEGGHVHTCIMHREVCVQRAYLPTKTAKHGCSLCATHRTIYFIRESDKERLSEGLFWGGPHQSEWSGVHPLPVIEVIACRLCRGALAAQEFLFAKASLQYIKKKDLPPLLSHVLTGLPPGKAAAPGKGFARNGMRGGGEVRRGGCRGFL